MRKRRLDRKRRDGRRRRQALEKAKAETRPFDQETSAAPRTRAPADGN